MSAVTVFAAEGIGAVNGQGLLELVRKASPRATWRYVEYPNNYGPVGTKDPARGRAYDDIRAEWVPKIAEQIQATIGDVILIGYSAGAHLMGDVALYLTRRYNATTARKLRHVYLVADPAAPTTTFPGRVGIAGARPLPGLPVTWISNPVDVICCCPIPSPWRTFYDITGGYSLVDRAKWTAGLQAKAVAKAFQPGSGSLLETIALGRGYLKDGQHTNWYVPKMAPIAAAINRAAE